MYGTETVYMELDSVFGTGTVCMELSNSVQVSIGLYSNGTYEMLSLGKKVASALQILAVKLLSS